MAQTQNQPRPGVCNRWIYACHPFDALIVGYYAAGKLYYVGKVRNGFVPQVRREVYKKFKGLEIKTCPFTNLTMWALTREEMKNCIWLKPELVAQIAFWQNRVGFSQRVPSTDPAEQAEGQGPKGQEGHGFIHSCLRAMLQDARIDGLIQGNLFDRDFFKVLPTTDTKPSIDPYTPEEREIILEAFRTKKPHYYKCSFTSGRAEDRAS